jgi:UDP-N-acetylmuramyl tripeptide synthase
VLSIAGWGTDSAQPVLVEVITDKETSAQTVQYFNYVANTLTSVTEGPKGVTATTTAIAGRLKPCGDAVASCITDAYTNHGWISVWATVQSAFLPETTAAIAVACVLHNC